MNDIPTGIKERMCSLISSAFMADSMLTRDLPLKRQWSWASLHVIFNETENKNQISQWNSISQFKTDEWNGSTILLTGQ